ncbi:MULTISPECIES: DUF1642 domain-containing protein [unclassified Streptococcus]|uniref:DUF1642 domain-containing protein n=1 Tax=unclassified Streptococcus TaxID=2608887 RepID=UPI0009209015|nr:MULTISPECIES: DUF1642 domain-containing protein [unclassified Streptococcus]MBF7050540.1 DUF1642 domain-containing protein [Streptococcus sp. HF-2466]OHR62332.1 hypothetical protein HMPREF2634_08565 [Streptococcus sp. HMSC034B03]
MNKQEAIEKINESRLAFAAILSRRNGKRPYFEKEVVVMKEKDLVDIINQIDEVEKTIVPWFVADWYEKYKDEFEYYLKGFIAKVGYEINHNTKDEFYQWLGNPHNDSILKLVNMHQFGYEVEKEKRYQVKFIQTGQHLAKNVFLPGEYFVIQANAISSTDSFTRKELEEAGFGWVFDCEGAKVEEVE